jgi:DNA-binding beta-propeller fold protein YncE
MPYRASIGGTLGLAFALSGCAGISSSSSHASAAWIPSDARSGKNLVYVADNNGVEIYPAGVNDPPRIGRITDGIAGADGLFVDPDGDLYVANLRGASVTVYRPGKSVPFEKYRTEKDPTDVVVGGDGTVYISQSSDGCICVTEYPPGSTMPKRTIPLKSSGGYPLFIALDSSNDLYVSMAYVGGGHILRVRAGRTKGSALSLPGLITPRGLSFTNSGALAVANDTLNFNYGFVDLYHRSKPEYKVLGQFVAGSQPEQITFGRDRLRMYVADAGYSEHGGSVAIFAAASGWKQVGSISRGLDQPSGVALSPDAF